ncbi:TonB-dependent receptor [uncultured Microscilla sp.]|uniref:TonB-dependent receptor domain-containing protein n=1 Tax=uncultured Microscilla sp. TaxID=432653 RepID=UPI0026059E08|nr:TonB-dependent receptor [uncultured Microscilla sp.]
MTKFTFIFNTTFFLILLATMCLKAQTIRGTLTDAKTKQPVEFAVLGLFQAGDTTQTIAVATTTSGIGGKFTLNSLKYGKYDLVISMVGYDKKTLTNLVVSRAAPNLNLNKVDMSSSVLNLDEIVVKAKREFIQAGEEGITVKADNNISQQGGSALDILRNIPGVTVDNDGNISLRGTDANILINGRNSALTGTSRGGGLESLPASAIKDINISTNPSAKYDAAGVGGVINIQLKKGVKTGLNALITLGASNRDRYNGSLRLNRRTDKFNWFVSYDARRNARRVWFDNQTDDFTRSDRQSVIIQDRDGDRVDINHSIKFGTDWFINDKTTLSVEGLLGTQTQDEPEFLVSRFGTDRTTLDSTTHTYNTEKEDNKVFEGALIFTRKFDKKGQKLSFSLSSNFGTELETQDVTTNILQLNSTNIDSTALQRSANNNTNNITNIQLDYIHPIGKKMKIETGYKAILRDMNLDFDQEIYDETTQTYVFSEELSNEFKYDEQVHAAYVLFKGKLKKKIGFNFGLRAEQVYLTAKSDNTQNIESKYFNLFPSARITYRVRKGEFFKVSYSKRIRRPRFRLLNPFRDISNPTRIRVGNPELGPELTHSAELGYNKVWSKISFIPSLFYRHTTNVIQRFASFDANSALVFRPVNLGTATDYGIELIVIGNLVKWWDFNASYAFFNREIDARNSETDLITSNTSWNAKLQSNWKLSKNTTLQLTGNYRAPIIRAQGTRQAFHSIDLGFRHRFLKGRATFGLVLTDIFNTRQFGFETTTSEFTSSGIYKRESQILRASLTYQIGKRFKTSIKKGRGNRRRRR